MIGQDGLEYVEGIEFLQELYGIPSFKRKLRDLKGRATFVSVPGRVPRNIERFLKAWSAVSKREVAYHASVKVNNTLENVAATLVAGGTIDAANPLEIAYGLRIKDQNGKRLLDPSSVMFSNPNILYEDMKELLNMGVRLFAFHDTRKLAWLKQAAKDAGIPLSELGLFCRIKFPELSEKVWSPTSKIANSPMTCIFGVDASILETVITFLQNTKNMGFNILGFSFHPGSQIKHKDAYRKWIELLGPIAREARRLNLVGTELCCGGGLPTPYDGEPVAAIEDILASTEAAITEHMDWVTKVRWEPGRYTAWNAVFLLGTCISRQPTSFGAGEEFLVVRPGYFHGLNEARYHQVRMFTERELQRQSVNKILLRVQGDSCFSEDYLKSIWVDDQIQEGESVVFTDVHAYCGACEVYNSIEYAQEHVVLWIPSGTYEMEQSKTNRKRLRDGASELIWTSVTV